MKYTGWGISLIITQYLCMVTDGNCIYCGDRFEIYRNTEHYVVYQELTLRYYHTSKTKKQTHRKRYQICGYQRQGVKEGKGNWDEGIQSKGTSFWL